MIDKLDCWTVQSKYKAEWWGKKGTKEILPKMSGISLMDTGLFNSLLGLTMEHIWNMLSLQNRRAGRHCVCLCLPVYLSVCLHMVGLFISPWARSDSNLLSNVTVNAAAPDDRSMLTLITNMPLSLIQHMLIHLTELRASRLNKYQEHSFNNSADNEL